MEIHTSTSIYISLVLTILCQNHMARCITIFLIVSVLLLTVAEGRSLFNIISPDSVSHKPVSSSHVTVSLEHIGFNNDDGGACKGLDRTECVVKATMVAHTDYVYTQDINGP
ncbi:phytosulfokines 1-like [Cajanus cajan]|uniref:phytosulfokines 1-like n=1 Tax=Cajanus cajan TaxID=3821 RepID=UPI0010FB854B|nr:phytosulfokines 1-like [Cajanus cajan]